MPLMLAHSNTEATSTEFEDKLSTQLIASLQVKGTSPLSILIYLYIFQLPSCSWITDGNNNGFFPSPKSLEHFGAFMATAGTITSLLLSCALIIPAPSHLQQVLAGARAALGTAVRGPSGCEHGASRRGTSAALQGASKSRRCVCSSVLE